MRASATSRIASHAAVTSSAQNSHASSKADDAASFALMLQAAAPKTKGADDKQSGEHDKQPAQDNSAQQSATPTQTSQAAAQAPAKPLKDAKTQDSDNQDAGQAAPSDAAADPSAVVTVALQPQPAAPQTTPVANDNTSDQTVDGVAAANTASPAAPQADDTDNDADLAAAAAKQAQATAQQPQAKPAAKAAPAAAADKPAPRKAATDDAKSTDTKNTDAKTADAQADIKTDVKPQADAKPAAPVQTALLDGIAAPQAKTPDAAPQVQVATQHIEVTAQPNVPALAVEIAAKSQSGAKQFDIRLDPPELGRVEVRLSIDATGKASAHLTADQPQTLDLLQKDSTNLTRALRDAGLDVSQDGLNFSLRQQNQDAGTNGGFGGNGRGRIALAATATTDTSNATSAYRAPLDGRLDIRV